MNAFRWVICFPLGVAVALAFSGIILRLGDAFVGSWRPASGLVVYTAAGNLPVIAMTLGLGVAPRVSRRLKWLLLSPHIAYGTLVALPTLAALVFSSEPFGMAGDASLSRSLTPGWQLGLWNVGYLAGILFAASRGIEERATAGPGEPESPGLLTRMPEVFWKETRYSRLAAKAFKLRERGRIPEAIDALHRARKTIEQLWAKDPATYAHPLGQIHRRLADARAEIGERGAAREHFEASVTLLRQADDAKPGLCTVELAETLVNMAVLYTVSGAYDLARVSLEDAHALFLALDKNPSSRAGDLALTEAHLGILLCEAGDLERGKRESKRALEKFRALDEQNPGSFTEDIVHTLLNLGGAYGELGSYEQSEVYLKEAMNVLDALDSDTTGAARARAALSLANVLSETGRPHEARATYEESLRQLEELEAARPGAFRMDLAKARQNQVNFLRTLGLFQEARAALEKNLALFQELDHHESGTHGLAISRASLGGLLLDLGELDEAKRELALADVLFQELEELLPGAHNMEWSSVHANIGMIEVIRGRLEETHAHWCRALELSEQRRGILVSSKGREQYQLSFVSLNRQMVRLCLDLGNPIEAWHFAERGRARGLLDLFAGARPKLSSSRDRELLDEWAATEQEVIRYLIRLDDPRERLLPPRHRRKYRDEASGAEVFAREEELRLRLQDQIGKSFLQVDVPQPELLAKALQQLVGGRRVLLLQWVQLVNDDAGEEQGPEPIGLFVLPLDADLESRAALEAAFLHTIVELEPGGTDKMLATLEEIVRFGSDAAFERLSDQMGEVFMLPVLRAVEELMGAPLAELGLEGLLLVPGRGFQVMPLHAARLDRHRDRYLVDEAPVFYLVSCHLAGQLTARKASSEADSVALMGPPPANDPFVDLPEAWKEVSKLREIFESRGFPIHVHQGSAMTVDALKRHSRRLALLHLATHSLFSTENALKSHVQFCGENLSLDRLLQEPELDFSGMKLVYLSSCDAGWMEGIWDEEPQGLVYGFLRAGAGAVMASLLPVLDDSARILAELFYEEVAKGRPLAEAHREALRLLRQIDGGHFGNPMHWASMMLHGAGLDRIVP